MICAREAKITALVQVRERCRRAEMAWLEMANRAAQAARNKAVNDTAKVSWRQRSGKHGPTFPSQAPALSNRISYVAGTMMTMPRSDPMRRLVYISRSLIHADVASLDAMVRQSSARNTSVGVTGMLWFDGANFAQVLEGEHDRVVELMERIEQDARHTDLQIVVDREVKGRAFGHWGMIQPDDGPESMESTVFLVGLSMAQRGPAAERLHDIVVACEM